SAQVRRNARIGLEEIEGIHVRWPVDGLHRDAFRGEPRRGRRRRQRQRRLGKVDLAEIGNAAHRVFLAPLCSPHERSEMRDQAPDFPPLSRGSSRLPTYLRSVSQNITL